MNYFVSFSKLVKIGCHTAGVCEENKNLPLAQKADLPLVKLVCVILLPLATLEMAIQKLSSRHLKNGSPSLHLMISSNAELML